MNIWFFNHYAVPPWYYPLYRPYKFAKNLIESGHNVTIFAASTVHNSSENLIKDNKQYKTEKIDKINYVYIKTSNYDGNGIDRIINMIQYSLKLLLVSKYFIKPDLIIATSVHPLTWLAGYFLSKKYDARFIAEIADLWPETLVAMGRIKKNSIPAKILYAIEKFIYEKADRLIFTMSGGVDYIRDKGWDKQIDLNKVNYINNGIDLEDFNKNAYTFQVNDKDILSKNIFKIMYTGSLGEANMVIKILQTAKVLQDKGIENIKFFIYGSGILEKDLKKYAENNELRNVYFKGRVEKKYIPFILRNGDLNIIVGKNIYLYKYGFSQNKFFDYLASGKPTISNRDCHNILNEKKCGLTVPDGSPEALAKGILKFYNMPKEEYNEYCKNALKTAKDFDFKVLTDKLKKIIIELESENKEVQYANTIN